MKDFIWPRALNKSKRAARAILMPNVVRSRADAAKGCARGEWLQKRGLKRVVPQHFSGETAQPPCHRIAKETEGWTSTFSMETTLWRLCRPKVKKTKKMAGRGGNVGVCLCKQHTPHLFADRIVICQGQKQSQRRTKVTHHLSSEMGRRSFNRPARPAVTYGASWCRGVSTFRSRFRPRPAVCLAVRTALVTHDNQVTTESLLSVIKCFKD